VKVDDFRGRIDAQAVIRDSMRAYDRFRDKLLNCQYPDY
jgi:hypothetical protein